MDEQPASFHFENSVGRFVKLLLLSLVVGSALGGITGISIMVLVAIVFGNDTPILSALGIILSGLSFLLIVGWVAVSSLKNWFWSLTYDQNGIIFRPLTGNQIAILSHEIKGIKRKGELIVFKTTGQDLGVDLAKFPLKERVIFNSYTKQ